jgi:energy-coupling factor transporter ATP-binding protein EcfA2
MPEAPALLIENLTFRYRDREEPTLKDISLTVPAGELLLIAGASGSGKTTLIRCINGLIPRSYKGELQGSILLNDQETRGQMLASISQVVGTVLQDPERQILGTRVRNEVAFGLENLGMERAEIHHRIDQALEYLGISALRDRETFHLSGGEKQKVALAGVLAMRPSILLLDEPLASLDPASAQDTLTMVRKLCDEGMTVLMIEHRIEDVLSIHPDRVLFIEEGRERYLGPLTGLYQVVNYHEIKIPAQMIMEVYSEEVVITTWTAPFSILGWQPTIVITVQRIFFALSQILRLFSISAMTVLIPYSINPAEYGIAFRGLGMPDKFAYAMDLTMRFVPSYGRDFQLTLDAQRARGYELEKLRGGLIEQVRKMAPLIVPVTIHAIIGSEDIIDAMDLRAFGIGPRTWLEQLHYRRRDHVLRILAVLILVISLILSIFGIGNFYIPPAFL